MSGKCFVDSDILVYAHDRTAGIKHLRAQMLMEQLWDSGWGVLSMQVLQELCICLCRDTSNPPPVEEVHHLIHDYSAWEVVPSSPASVQNALELVTKYKIHFWDAMVLEAAERSGATILYSEHLANGQRYGAVQVVNPFATA